MAKLKMPGRAAKQLAGPTPKKAGRTWKASRHLVIGFAALALLVGGLGSWSIFTNIAGAIVASGSIEVESNRQVVQHPEGGVVGEINVDDGDTVAAGDILIRLDDTQLRSELAVIESQLFELIARRGRLQAESEGRSEIKFPADIDELAATSNVDVDELKAGQQRLFEARRNTVKSEAEQLEERKQQIDLQINGVEAQLSALEKQLVLIRQQLANTQSLVDDGLARMPELLALQREEAQLFGRVGELQAGVAENRGRIAEIQISLVKLESDLREDAITTLRDLQYRELELRERRLSSIETLTRLEVRAPVPGVIYGNTIFALRSVVRPAEPIMYVVPQDSPLVISSRIETINIDEVRVGQEAKLVFSAFDARTTPELEGQVTKVSADVFTDETTGASYYLAEILPKDGELEKLGDRDLLPGMPVDSFIKTRDRSPLNYLIKPMADYFNRAFRES